MAIHVRGVVLPDNEVRDLWLDGDRVSLEPVPGAETVSDGGYILPGRVAEAIEVAHAAGARVAVHTFSEEAVATLVRAGVDSVEHGTGLSLDLIDEMARRGTTLTPTMINIQRFDEIAAQAEGRFPK